MPRRRPWEGQGSAASRGYGAAWRKVRQLALERDKGLCQPCRREGRVTAASAVHHIKAKAAQGTDDLDNLEAVCDPCHAGADAANRGHRVKPTFDAAGRPIWRD